MASHYIWDKDIIEYINKTIPHRSCGLDIGAGYGKYYNFLGNEYDLDCIEIYEPYIEQYHLRHKYKNVYNVNALDFIPDKKYNFSIMGDCLEHMNTVDAKKLIHRLQQYCDECIFVIPYEYPQDIMNGNEFEIHLQPDLTPFNVKIRYPTLYPLLIKYDGDGTFCDKGIGIGVYTTKPISKENVKCNFTYPIIERLFLDLYFNENNL